MSWKSLVTAGLLCVLASPVLAAPTLSVTGSINNKNATPVRVWNVAVAPDVVIDPSGTAIALEIGLRAVGGNILSVVPHPNPPVPPNPDGTPQPTGGPVEFLNPGNVIFGWETLTQLDFGMFPVGIQIGTGANANEAFAAVGTTLFPAGDADRNDLLLVTTQSSVTELQWGGRYLANGDMGPTDPTPLGSARIAQGETPQDAVNYHGFSGSLAALGPANQRFLVDMNGNNSVTFADLTPLGTALNNPAGYKTQFPHLNRLRGDANGNGSLTFADLTGIGQILQGNVSGASLGGGSAVPEPASVALVGCIVAFCGMIRRRSK